MNQKLEQKKMPSEDTDGQRTPPQNSAVWLNLSLARDPSEAMKESDEQSRVASAKVYSCNFCMRKFYSSQALGGHQNAHKKERGAVRQYQSHKMMTMMALPTHNSVLRSRGVQTHSPLHKLRRGETKFGTRFMDANARVGIVWQSGKLGKAANTMWPGSFRPDAQQQEQNSSKSSSLDLNLKL